MKIYCSLLWRFLCVCSQDCILEVLEDVYSRKKNHFFFILGCSLPFIKSIQGKKYYQLWQILEEKSDMLIIFICKLLRMLCDVILQQHCPYLERILLQDYPASRKHNNSVLWKQQCNSNQGTIVPGLKLHLYWHMSSSWDTEW